MSNGANNSGPSGAAGGRPAFNYFQQAQQLYHPAPPPAPARVEPRASRIVKGNTQGKATIPYPPRVLRAFKKNGGFLIYLIDLSDHASKAAQDDEDIMVLNTRGEYKPKQPRTDLRREKMLDFGTWYTLYRRYIDLLHDNIGSADVEAWASHGEVVQRLFTVERCPVAAAYCLQMRILASNSPTFDPSNLNNEVLNELMRAYLLAPSTFTRKDDAPADDEDDAAYY